MKELHLFYAPDVETTGMLPPEESAHAVRVLRMHEGDPICVVDGRGTTFSCVIAAASPRGCLLSIEKRCPEPPRPGGGVHLAVAPTKSMERMEWLAEKATEIGIDSLTFLATANTERRVVKAERVEKIVVGAMKQSHKARLPHVEGLVPFDAFVQRPFQGRRFIAHCYGPELDGPAGKPFLADVLAPGSDALVMVGPEGDFTPDEVRRAMAAGFIPVSLSDSRLRTETAALVAVHLMGLAGRGK